MRERSVLRNPYHVLMLVQLIVVTPGLTAAEGSSKGNAAASTRPTARTVSSGGGNTHLSPISPEGFSMPSSVRSYLNEASQLGAISSDDFTGSVALTIPISLKDRAAGLKPDVHISYRSNSRGGPLGTAWNLSVSSIRRSTRFGVDFAASDFEFSSDSASTMDLTFVGDYRAKFESKFSRFRQIAGHDMRPAWEMTDTRGVRYTFGMDDRSREMDPSNVNHVFAWLVDRIEDTNGNFVTYSYVRGSAMGSSVYLDTIEYGGHFGGPSRNVDHQGGIKLFWEPRPDVTSSYESGFLVRNEYRLRSVVVSAKSVLVRAYSFDYRESENTGASLLAAIRVSGNDSVVSDTGQISGGTAMPAYRFSWHDAIASFDVPSESRWRSPGSLDHGLVDDTGYAWVDFAGNGRPGPCRIVKDDHGHGLFGNPRAHCLTVTPDGFGVDVISRDLYSGERYGRGWADVDGDGKADYCRTNPNKGQEHVRCTPSGGSYFRSDEITSQRIDLGQSFGRAWVDADGDGRADYCRLLGVNNVSCLLSRGTSFEGERIGALKYGFGLEQGRIWTDVSGDGRVDFCRLIDDQGHRVACLVSTPFGFGADVRSDPLEWGQDAGRQWADVNGDRKADFCRVVGNASAAKAVCTLSAGFGFGQDIASASINPGQDAGRGWSDLNGDRRADYCRAVYNASSGQHQVSCLLARNDTFGTEIAISATDWGYDYTQLWIDVNTDGRTDFCRLVGSGRLQCTLAATSASDLLRSSDNGFGRLTTFTYGAAGLLAPQRFVPFPVWVVTSVSDADGFGVTATSDVTYRDGYYDSALREFRGFGFVRRINPPDVSGNRTVTEVAFHQGDSLSSPGVPTGTKGAMRGKPHERITLDSRGRLLDATRFTYAGSGGPPFFRPLSVRSTRTYEADQRYSATSTSYEYDQYGNVTREVRMGDPITPLDDHLIERMFINDTAAWVLGLQTEERLSSGAGVESVVQMRYDEGSQIRRGLLTSRIQSGLDLQPDIVERYVYDEFGNLAGHTDGRGNTTSHEFDVTGRFLLATIDALQHTQSFTYVGINADETSLGPHGLQATVRDPNGAIARYSYDPLGRPMTLVTPDGGTTEWRYIDFGTPSRQSVDVALGLGVGSSVAFDGLFRGRMISTWEAHNKRAVQSVAYDARGLLVSHSLPAFQGSSGPSETLTYDSHLRLSSISRHAGFDSIVRHCYSPRYVITLDENGHATGRRYDAFARLTSVDEFSGATDTCESLNGLAPYSRTTYAYNARGDLTTVFDGLGNRTTMGYDPFGRRVSIDDPDSGRTKFVFDSAGNVVQRTDARGRTVFYQYDSLNRLIQKDHDRARLPGRGMFILTHDTAVNGVGRLASESYPNGRVAYDYDQMGRRISERRTEGWRIGRFLIGRRSARVTSSYDAVGRLATVTYPPGRAVSYTYSGPSLTRVADQTQTYVEYLEFDAAGRILLERLGKGAQQSRSYGPQSSGDCPNAGVRLCTMRTMAGGIEIDSVRFRYDLHGNIASISRSDPAATREYTYDERNRLLRVDSGHGTLVESFSYDKIGNLLTKERAADDRRGAETTDYSVHRAHALSSVSGRRLVYDAAGNLIDDGRRVFDYDAEERLTGVLIRPRWKALLLRRGLSRFFYDSAGTRTASIEDGRRTSYFGRFYRCSRSTCNDDVFAGDVRIASIVRQPTYFVYDHMGSVTASLEDRGTVVARMTYSAFGESGQGRSNYMFAGREWNQSSGVYLNGRRYYDPVLGRFITPEVALANLGDPQSLNRYSYAANNPITLRDVTGRWPDNYEPNLVLRMPNDLRLTLALGIVGSTLLFGPPGFVVSVEAAAPVTLLHVLTASRAALAWANLANSAALIATDTIARPFMSDEEIVNMESNLKQFTIFGVISRISGKASDLAHGLLEPKEAFETKIEGRTKKSLLGVPLEFKSADAVQREIAESADQGKSEPKDKVTSGKKDHGHDPDPNRGHN